MWPGRCIAHLDAWKAPRGWGWYLEHSEQVNLHGDATWIYTLYLAYADTTLSYRAIEKAARLQGTGVRSLWTRATMEASQCSTIPVIPVSYTIIGTINFPTYVFISDASRTFFFNCTIVRSGFANKLRVRNGQNPTPPDC